MSELDPKLIADINAIHEFTGTVFEADFEKLQRMATIWRHYLTFDGATGAFRGVDSSDRPLYDAELFDGSTRPEFYKNIEFGNCRNIVEPINHPQDAQLPRLFDQFDN